MKPSTMKMSGCRFVISGIALLLMGISTAAAEEYRDEAKRFRAPLPEGWSLLTDEEMAPFRAASDQKPPGATGKIRYVAGMAPRERPESGFPYLLIQELPAIPGGHSWEKVEGDTAKGNAKGAAAAGAELGDVSLDRERGRLRYVLKIKTPDGEVLVCRTSTIFGRHATFGVHAYCRESERKRWIPYFDTVVDRMGFEPGQGYDPGLGMGPIVQRIVDGGANGAIYGAVGGVIGAVIVLLYSRMKPKATRPGPPPMLTPDEG